MALVMGEQTISHGELQARSNHFANRLVQAGVGRGAIVGIAMERSLEMVICLLSVLKAGAAYLPLDPASPAERQRFMLADSGASHLIAHRSALHKLGTPAVAHLVVAEEVDFTQACNAAPAHAVHERDLAYVIYTSGSTGQPKGVVVEHGPLSMHCAATAGIYGMRANSRELHFMSFSFDGAHERWLTALSIGAGLVLREPQMWTAEQACEALRHHASPMPRSLRPIWRRSRTGPQSSRRSRRRWSCMSSVARPCPRPPTTRCARACARACSSTATAPPRRW
ncbi:hypothetical protein GY15_04045 [Delftia sp. 670]|nr:hypothetical protein GY15_04045 [Delftia sp. 670]